VGPNLETSAGCVHCRSDRFAFERVIRLGVYYNRMRSACLQAKSRQGRPLTAAMADVLWEREKSSFLADAFDIVVPVPHHWTARLTSAHVMAETLAGVLSRRLQVPLGSHILAKVRRTPTQTSLTASRRRTNLRRAFRVQSHPDVEGRSVLLVDDVLTTGTTANKVSRVLKRAGAGRVVVAVVARGLGQDRVAT
jgi:ComF family protein